MGFLKVLREMEDYSGWIPEDLGKRYVAYVEACVEVMDVLEEEGTNLRYWSDTLKRCARFVDRNMSKY